MTDGPGQPRDRQSPENPHGSFRGGGFGGRPTLRTGEPVLARWFVILLLIVVPVGFGVIVWAFLSFDREPVEAAARRPPGTVEITHQRGVAVLAETDEVVPFEGCVSGIDLVGDIGGIATARRALEATCQLAEGTGGELVAEGLRLLAVQDGIVRVAIFEATGVDATMLLDEGRPIIELNAKFQFDVASRAAPALIHELIHLAQGWPAFGPVDARTELEALEQQLRACARLIFADQEPRTCLDVRQFFEEPDPLAALVEAGYRA